MWLRHLQERGEEAMNLRGWLAILVLMLCAMVFILPFKLIMFAEKCFDKKYTSYVGLKKKVKKR